MHWELKLATFALLTGTALAVSAQMQTAAARTQAQPTAAQISAAEIVAKNASARGGRAAWRKVETMAWAGRAESSSSPGRVLPFLLEQKRPDHTRFEIGIQGQRSVRVFDGTAGWNVKPDSKGRPESTPYSEVELRFARGASVIDGPLMDLAARGAAITLDGRGRVGDRDAYILGVKLPSGGNHRVWVDAATFLELRYDRDVRSGYGEPTAVTVLYRNYREFEGLQIPLIIETVSPTAQATNTLMIERVALNPQLDESQFAPPSQPTVRRHGALVDTRSAAPPQVPGATR